MNALAGGTGKRKGWIFPQLQELFFWLRKMLNRQNSGFRDRGWWSGPFQHQTTELEMCKLKLEYNNLSARQPKLPKDSLKFWHGINKCRQAAGTCNTCEIFRPVKIIPHQRLHRTSLQWLFRELQVMGAPCYFNLHPSLIMFGNKWKQIHALASYQK